jgi:hypothetical protein
MELLAIFSPEEQGAACSGCRSKQQQDDSGTQKAEAGKGRNALNDPDHTEDQPRRACVLR